MPTTTYYSVDGEIFGETEGGVSRNYVRDALGSVVAVTDTAGNKLYEARYKPYGDVLWSTGTAPSFTWVGVYGYLRAAGSVHNEFSVRARFYGSKEARWAVADPFWPKEKAFIYAGNSPVQFTDPSGKWIYLIKPWWFPLRPLIRPLGGRGSGPFPSSPFGPFPYVDPNEGWTPGDASYPGANIPPPTIPPLPPNGCNPGDPNCPGLADAYHKTCPYGSTTTGGSAYTACSDIDSPLTLTIKLGLWCACAFLKREYTERCIAPQNRDATHEAQIAEAESQCAKCRFLAPPQVLGPPDPGNLTPIIITGDGYRFPGPGELDYAV